MDTSTWFLTLKSVGATAVWVCPCLQSPAVCASNKGQKPSHLCRWWKQSDHTALEPVEVRSFSLSWIYLIQEPLESPVAALLSLSEATNGLKKKKKKRQEQKALHYHNVWALIKLCLECTAKSSSEQVMQQKDTPGYHTHAGIDWWFCYGCVIMSHPAVFQADCPTFNTMFNF